MVEIPNLKKNQADEDQRKKHLKKHLYLLYLQSPRKNQEDEEANPNRRKKVAEDQNAKKSKSANAM